MNFIVDRHYIIVEERGVTNVLSKIDEQNITGVNVRKCVYSKNSSMWSIHFDASKRKWDSIIEELKTIDGVIIER